MASHNARPRRRRRRRKLAQAAVVAGISCWVSALFFLVLSAGGHGDRPARQRLAVVFAVGGAALFTLRALGRAVFRRRETPGAAPPSADGRAGMTLVVALAIGAALSALSLHALATARAEVRRAESAARARRLGAMAAGEAVRRLRELAADDDLRVDHPGEAWAKTAAYALPDGARVESRVEDENRRFNVNNVALASAESGRRTVVAVAAELLALGGAPDARRRIDALRAAMRDPRPDVEPGFLPLRMWADVTGIEGFDRDFLDRETDGIRRRLRPADALTVAPFDALHPMPVNINTAPAEVLAGVFGRERTDVVRAVESLRSATPLRSIEPVALLLDPIAFDGLRPWLDVRSALFRVDARAVEGDAERRVLALARRDDSGLVRVLEWAER